MVNNLYNPVPSGKIEKTNAQFSRTSIAYNQSGYQYNQPGNTYGGSDRLQDAPPLLLNVYIGKPFATLSRSHAAFGQNQTAYNQAGYQYNKLGNTYGGADRVQDGAPVFLRVLNITPTILSVSNPSTSPQIITLYAGMPMGLLLAITYPVTTTYQS